MSPTIISALAALGGSILGAFALVFSSYVLQVGTTRRHAMDRNIALRQKLYSKFIRSAARLHADAMTRSEFDMKEIAELYSLLGRIRLIASETVAVASDETVKAIIQRYGEANVTLEDVRTAALASNLDPLQQFSVACRNELQKIARLG